MPCSLGTPPLSSPLLSHRSTAPPLAPPMSSLISTPGMALATAMAVSGTVILMALCRPRPLSNAASARYPAVNHRRCNLRPCITSAERKRERRNMNKKKRVSFGEDVVVEFEGEDNSNEEVITREEEEEEEEFGEEFGGAFTENQEVHLVQEMPANRVALYNGILQDRMQRMTCSY